MQVDFTSRESSAVRHLLAESASDIILKTDRGGFVLHASPAIERWGLPLPNTLIGSHIEHLAHPACAAAVRAEHEATIAGEGAELGRGWLEFLALTADGAGRWFEIRMERLVDESGAAYGAVCLMHSIEERRRYEERLFAAAMTDPLTGLTNRPAFIQMLGHLIEQQTGGYLAIFDIDHFKQINMQYGQAVGDEVLVVFADLLRTLMRGEDIISRIGGQSLGVLLPAASLAQAEAICQRIVATLSEARRAGGAQSRAITASAGVAEIAGSLDATIKRAETALFLAKAKGRNRVEIDRPSGPGASRTALPRR